MTDYILDARTYLPKFLKDSPIMLSVMDCLNVLISKENTVFEEIQGSYHDMLYKVRDYSKLTDAAKMEIIKELGFDYVLDIISLSSEQLTQLITFFNLIYALKGKKEGLELVLDIMGLVYTYEVWDEKNPHGQMFTATLTIVGNDYQELKVFKRIKNFVRSYMLPWIDVIIETTVEATLFYMYPLWGAQTRYKEEVTKESYLASLTNPEIAKVIKYHESIAELNYLRINNIDEVATVLAGNPKMTLDELQNIQLKDFKG